MGLESNEKIRGTVREGYTDIAKGKSSCCCGSSAPEKLAEAIGYTNEGLESIARRCQYGIVLWQSDRYSRP